ncbi:uncharacterized protein LOC125028514 [Penaeus chinensis]|uniref:uncharacterized protein LOC125028514 n=1 Tax=Penaeus chinensis TaxID=139456 RepID=UPI001FB6B769|nr:uncharacterized protein LOC125028514 [Penaeus chinensis]
MHEARSDESHLSSFSARSSGGCGTMSLSRDDAIALGLAIILREKKNSSRQRKRRCVKAWIARKEHSHTNLIMNELQCETDDWRNYLRMDEGTYNNLLELVSPYIKRENTNMREAITPHERLSATLRFLATGRSLKDLRYSARMGTSTLSEIIPETCNAIFHVLRGEFLQFPKTEQEWTNIGNLFEEKWNFPNCLGAVDGKHVHITPPKDAGSYFYNYKGYNSLVLMAVVNANYEFLYADIGTNGRVSDGGVLNNTTFGKKNSKTTNFTFHPLGSTVSLVFSWEMKHLRCDLIF